MATSLLSNTKKKEEDQAAAYRPYTYTDYRQNVFQNYTPVDTSGNDYAALTGVSQADYDALSNAWAQWDAADKAGDRAGKDAAHAAAEAIRTKYGYSGGEDGSQYLQIQQPSGGFDYGSAPTYTEKYQTQIDDLLSGILNREEFSYNYLDDPLYQQLRDSYTREGNRAMLDTMGQAAARTGGYLSTAGQVAAQQANNYYMSQLGDKIPELQQLAYQMYMNDIDSDRTNLGLMQGLEAFNYDKYLTDLGQYNTDRDFAYGVYRDQIGDEQYADETAYERALQRAQMLAAAGDYSGFGALGYSDSDIATLQAYQQLLNQKSSGKSAGSGGSSNPASGSESGVYQSMYDGGIRSYDDAYEWLRSQGYNTTDANRYAKGLVNKIEAGDFLQEAAEPAPSVYGPKYQDLYRDAYTMKQNGKSAQEILEHLDQYSGDGITEAGALSIIRNLGLA